MTSSRFRCYILSGAVLIAGALAHVALADTSAKTNKSAPAAAAAPPADAGQTQPAASPIGTEPQRTTASFGDWVMRCERPAAGGAKICEVAQILTNQGQPVAQIAVGRPTPADRLMLTMLVPSNLVFAVSPRLLVSPADKDGPVVTLGWRRCLPGGCVADVTLPDDMLHLLRTRTEPSRLVFQDAAGREAALPLSPRGLAQALDALGKE